jgi:hypothetical protein
MPGIIPASKTPRRKRTPEALWISFTKAVQMEQIPKPREIDGINHPGPIHLQAMFEGISKMM